MCHVARSNRSFVRSLSGPIYLLRAGVIALASSAMLLAGCAGDTTATESNSFVPAATIAGRIHGGQQPLAEATVDLYAVGTTGYGLGATRLATTISANGSGAFAFTQKTTQTGADSPVDSSYGCPTNTTLLYLVASGGDPTGAGTGANANSNIRLLDAIGPCSATKTGFYDINEVSTVVSVAALQQYINPLQDLNIGVPTTTGSGSNMSSAMTGITNAFALVQNVLNQSAGTVNPTFTPSGGIAALTATPEVAKINTIADILAACVNTTGSSSSACSTLLSAATPPTLPKSTNFASSYSPAPVPVDTLSAALFMLVNPTDAGTQVTNCTFGGASTNLGCLFDAVTASAPFPALTSAPTDWTIAITYASTATATVSSTTVPYLTYADYLAIDKSGDVWLVNNVYPSGGSLVELSPSGAILQQALATPGVLTGPHATVIDPAGNVWVPNFGSASSSSSNTVGYGTTVVEFPLNGTALSANSFHVAGCPYGLAADGAGNIFVGECTAVGSSPTGNTTPGNDIEKIPSGSASGTTATILYTASGGFSADAYSGIALDSNFRLYTTTDSTTVYSFATPYTTPISTTATDSEPIGIDNANEVWVANYGTVGSPLLSEYTVANNAFSSVGPFGGGGLGKAELLAIDGSGNIWITNYTSGAGYVSEFAGTNTTTNGTALSPSVGYLHTFGGAYGIAIDPSGNVWVGNNSSSAHAAVTTVTSGGGGVAAGGFLTEIIGAAVPVVTPIAAGLPVASGGTSYIGTTPK